MTPPLDQFGRIPYATIESGGLRSMKPADAVVYLAVAAHADANWTAHIGQRRIAALTGFYMGRVNESMQRLIAAGLIEIITAGSGTRPAEIRLCVRENPNATLPPSVPATPNAKRPERRTQRSGKQDLAFGKMQFSVRAGPNKTEEQRNRERRTGKKPVVEPMLPGMTPPPTGTPDRSPVAYSFTTTGGPWHMTEHQRDKLRDEFVFVHVDTELTGLASWTAKNPKIKPGAMWGWLRHRLALKQTERPLSTVANYINADGSAHCFAELPGDPTLEELNEIFPIEELKNAD